MMLLEHVLIQPLQTWNLNQRLIITETGNFLYVKHYIVKTFIVLI